MGEKEAALLFKCENLENNVPQKKNINKLYYTYTIGYSKAL